MVCPLSALAVKRFASRGWPLTNGSLTEPRKPWANVVAIGDPLASLSELVKPLSPWLTAKEIGEQAPEVPNALVEELFICGAITELSAKIKAGKTTFTGAMLRAIFAGEPIIGLRTQRAPILYLTEEGPNTFRSMLWRAGLLDECDLHVLMRGSAPKMPWPQLVKDVVLPRAVEIGAMGIIVDTLSRWAGVKGDQENHAGAAAEAMEPLEDLRHEGMAVLTIHHDKKGDAGQMADASRGSSAWGGAGDVLAWFQNPNVNGHPNRRHMETLGRFNDPRMWVMDLFDGEYTLVSEGDPAVEGAKAYDGALRLLATQPFKPRQLQLALGTSQPTTQRALDKLLDEKKVKRTGGRGRDGYVYELA
jgi:hypothetical protein